MLTRTNSAIRSEPGPKRRNHDVLSVRQARVQRLSQKLSTPDSDRCSAAQFQLPLLAQDRGHSGTGGAPPLWPTRA